MVLYNIITYIKRYTLFTTKEKNPVLILSCKKKKLLFFPYLNPLKCQISATTLPDPNYGVDFERKIKTTDYELYFFFYF